jgi:hypothetical protein
MNDKTYFGACPHCGRTDGLLNHGPHHWGICDGHRTKWFIGSNLFSFWQDETDYERAYSEQVLEDYEAVEPIRPADQPPLSRMTQEESELINSCIEQVERPDNSLNITDLARVLALRTGSRKRALKLVRYWERAQGRELSPDNLEKIDAAILSVGRNAP